jgi:hypothetical protein
MRRNLSRGHEATVAYQPMTMTDLAKRLHRQQEEKVKWKHVWEFLEEYRWEPADALLR